MTRRQQQHDNYDTSTVRKQQEEAYVDWVTERIQGGFEGTLLTFKFKPIKGSETSIAMQMEAEVVGVYAKILPFEVRRPAKTPMDQLPLWIGCADWPVLKSERSALAGLAANGGRHIHAVALSPPQSRLKTSLGEHIRLRQHCFAGEGHKLLDLHAEPISRTPRDAIAYVIKSLKRRRIDAGEIFLLPRSKSELGGRDW